MNKHHLAGIYAAAITPLKPDFSPDMESLPKLLGFLAERGCHGALLLGTTGEGTSFSREERKAIWQAALAVREEHPHFKLFAGTGTPSVEETVTLTRIAFELGYDAVVTLPPYYYRKATDDGLFTWFSEVIQRAVPRDGSFLAYHFPQVSGVSLSIELLERLKERFPQQFQGLKDSSGELSHAQSLKARLGADCAVLVGNDKVLSDAMQAGAAGAITALANLNSPDLRAVWDAHQGGERNPEAQARLDAARDVQDKYPPAPAFLKAMLQKIHGFPNWPLKPPLMGLSAEGIEKALRELQESEKLDVVRGA